MHLSNIPEVDIHKLLETNRKETTDNKVCEIALVKYPSIFCDISSFNYSPNLNEFENQLNISQTKSYNSESIPKVVHIKGKTINAS